MSSLLVSLACRLATTHNQIGIIEEQVLYFRLNLFNKIIFKTYFKKANYRQMTQANLGNVLKVL